MQDNRVAASVSKYSWYIGGILPILNIAILMHQLHSVVGTDRIVETQGNISRLCVFVKVCLLHPAFFSLKHSCLFLPRHFGHLSHSCIKTCHNSVFSLHFQTFWPKWLNFFWSFKKRLSLLTKKNLDYITIALWSCGRGVETIRSILNNQPCSNRHSVYPSIHLLYSIWIRTKDA